MANGKPDFGSILRVAAGMVGIFASLISITQQSSDVVKDIKDMSNKSPQG